MTDTEVNLLPCPFCGGSARIESNRDWHRLFCAHDDDCALDADDHDLMYPAQPGYLKEMAEVWNRRASSAASAPGNDAPGEPEMRAEFHRQHEGRDLKQHGMRGTYLNGNIAALWNQHKRTVNWMMRRFSAPVPDIGIPTSKAMQAAAPAAVQGDDSDPLYDKAVTVVRVGQRASISMVQRVLIIGYNRAARLLEAMEKNGVISHADSSGRRTVLPAPASQPAAQAREAA